MQVRESSRSARLPIVCHACGHARHVPLVVVRQRDAIACDACGHALNLAAVAATIPASLKLEDGHASPARRVSEFP